MWFPLVVLIAQLAAAPAPVQRAYRKLTSQEIESHKAKHKPPKDATRIDISEKIRSASFGHKTWLIVDKDGDEFWVENGRSTNRPGGLYGPFTVEEKEAAPAPEPTPPPATK